MFVGVRMPAVEVAARVERIRETLVAAGAPLVAAEPHGDEALLAVHDAALVEWLRGAWAEWERAGLPDDPGQDRVIPYNFARRGVGARREPVAAWARAGWFAYDTMTPIGPGTWEAARAAVDCALTAVDLVAGGEPAAYACVRPPGHHACRDGFGGACYLNNAAVAAEALRARLGGPVAVVDVDAHHGNGTQELFYERADVVVASVHVDPGAGWFPHALGFADETGSGAGAGANLNLPLAPGAGDDDWLAGGRRGRRAAPRGARGARRLARRRRRRRRPREPAAGERGRLPRGGPDPRGARAADRARPGGRLRPRDDSGRSCARRSPASSRLQARFFRGSRIRRCIVPRHDCGCDALRRPLPEGGTIGVPAPASGYFNRSEVAARRRVVGGAGLPGQARRARLRARRLRRGRRGEARRRPDGDVPRPGGRRRPVLPGRLRLDADDPVPRLRRDRGAPEGASSATPTSPPSTSRCASARGSRRSTATGSPAWATRTRPTSAATGSLEVLRGGGTGEVPRDPDDPYVRAIRGGKVTAPLVGGCLWLLMQTMGTPWEVSLDGCILFFEDVDAPAWYVDGNLLQLQQAGKLDGVVGVVVGDMDKCDWREQRPEWPRTRSIEDVLERYLEPLGVPVLYKLPLGHGKHLAALPLGVEATLDADARTLTIDQPCLVVEGQPEEGAA